jgi:hypothetical protein
MRARTLAIGAVNVLKAELVLLGLSYSFVDFVIWACFSISLR